MIDTYGFYTGKSFDAYEFLGAHKNGDAWTFRTFAPSAEGIALLIADQEVKMEKCLDGNFFETTVSDVKPGDKYEYRVFRHGGGYTDHCDPYGYAMELRPDHRSVLWDLDGYAFSDQDWMKERTPRYDEPLNIYEMHVGSWRKKGEGNEDWYTYDELAPLLTKYLKESGYNYVEFMPICEYPSDESWGYQGTGFFAPTSRYGTPEQLMELIDTLHQNDIGVIMDFVPVHFAVDAYGLALYDGAPLYEYPNDAVGVSEWGSHNFMHSRGEVRSFLQSACNFWLNKYHFDGIRMDAISRIIYWQGEPARGENGMAIDFLKILTSGVKERNPGVALFAEDSTNFPKVTADVKDGGLGFDYKWDLGWMHDTLGYMQSYPDQRLGDYHKLTFSMLYYWKERYVLPFSHDEVVHGKATILQKMNGDYDGKFPQARALYMYMMIHPGKKLNFMGNEIGQMREWDEKREQDWDIRKYPVHDSFYRYIVELNRLYLHDPAFYQLDYAQDGFEWLDCHEEGRTLYAILRKAGDSEIAGFFNFSDRLQEDFTVSVPGIEDAKALLYSDWQEYNGNTPKDKVLFKVEKDAFTCALQPFSGLLVSIKRDKETDR